MIMDLITARKHTDKIFLEMTDFLDSFLEAGTPGFTLSKPITCTAALMLMERGCFFPGGYPVLLSAGIYADVYEV